MSDFVTVKGIYAGIVVIEHEPEELTWAPGSEEGRLLREAQWQAWTDRQTECRRESYRLDPPSMA